MAETDPAGSRHEDQIQHVREVNNRQSSCGGIGEYREGMERRIGTLIGCHRMRIKTINESSQLQNLKRQPKMESESAIRARGRLGDMHKRSEQLKIAVVKSAANTCEGSVNS